VIDHTRLALILAGVVLAEIALLIGILVYMARADRVFVIGFQDRAPVIERMAREARSTAGGLVLPVAGVRPDELEDSYDAMRSTGRRHQGLDIMAERGTPVLAAAAGVVVRKDTAGLGGNAIYKRGEDGRTIYYYAHLDAFQPGLRVGNLVRAGEPIGRVGSTGNAPESAPHLHFEVYTVTNPNTVRPGRHLNPYALLARER